MPNCSLVGLLRFVAYLCIIKAVDTNCEVSSVKSEPSQYWDSPNTTRASL